MYFQRSSCIKIPLTFKDEEWFKNIKSDLTRREEDYNNPGLFLKKEYFHERDGNLLIPRYYDVRKYGHEIIPFVNDGENIDIEFKSKLRDEKQTGGLELLTTSDYGVLCMQPGEGKTVVAIAAICELKKKSIIFVHKDSLATQWQQRFSEHSTITEDQIGMLKTEDRLEVLQKPIVISTVQTLNSMVRRVPNIEVIMTKANFGIAIWDECHTSVSAESFSLSSIFLPSKRTFGLSATPRRSDNNTDIIEKHVGKVFVPKGAGQTMEPKIIVLKFDHRAVANHRSYIYYDFVNKCNNFDKGKYLQMLSSNKNSENEYIRLMRKVCKKVYDAGRTTLCLSDRIKVLDDLATVVPKEDTGFFIPRSGDKRDSNLLKRFVFSTYGSARDGTDRPGFDCLIMATNTSNIEQCIGRVVRIFPNKQQPVVFDIVDEGCEEMMKAFNNRMKFYESKKWVVEVRNIK